MSNEIRFHIATGKRYVTKKRLVKSGSNCNHFPNNPISCVFSASYDASWKPRGSSYTVTTAPPRAAIRDRKLTMDFPSNIARHFIAIPFSWLVFVLNSATHG